ncbi:MAG: exopolysaccharide biosynthesis polyprenyl glycosylphosphotransferase [Endomicrobiaceae bacterium]|nr:exopolysaccharide biosynthesis polyprenyl glycosylphosphotransferase [Endomicrobiaceae bacterium]MDD3923213.1 exopolysaccharide biosynthesis polyprenyl glycosylphosphotransferase [Endomicrobiaceae bacterium]
MRISKKKIIFILSLLIADTFVLILSVYLSVYLRFLLFADFFPYPKIDDLFILKYIQTLRFIIPIWLLFVNFSNSYKSFFVMPADEFVRILKLSTSFILSCIVLSFIIKVDYSRTVFVLVWLNLLIFMFLSRQIFKLIVGYILKLINKRNIILMIGKNVKKYRDIFKNNFINKVFYYPLILKLEDIEKIKVFIVKKQIKQIIIIDYNINDYELLSLYDWAESNNVIFKILPSEVNICRGEITVDSTLGVPVFQFISNSLTGLDYFLKRMFDIIISLTVLLLLFPFLAILVILIKMETKGNVIYTQVRQGYRGKEFNFYKFRSMVQDADDKLKDIKVDNSLEGGVFFKIHEDPRITKIGSFIRKYSIDEIPQLFNVLKGDMSLIGPRPLVLWEAKQVENKYYNSSKKRLRVLPGMTGLWQVSGRSLLSDERRIELDVFYVEHWSFGMDIIILFKTIWVVFFPKGAY